jgi:competence protein ComEC
VTSRFSERWAQASALMRRLAVAALVGLVVVLTACSTVLPPAERPADPANELELHFFDVGQGDAVLIRAPSGRSVLYDGGPDGERLMALLDSAGVTSLELVIASHNHADHIGGLAEVIERYRPRFVLENGIPHTTRTYERFLRAVVTAGSQRLEPGRRTIMLDSVRLVVLPPPGNAALGQNDNSVGLRVEFGEFSATMLGDAEPRQQDWWLGTHPYLFGPVQVHKASHHGSANGDTPAMLGVLRPSVVVIGVGADNRYGHPHPDMLTLYREFGVDVYRTDVHGTVKILAQEDGKIHILTPGLRDPNGSCGPRGCARSAGPGPGRSWP